MEFHPQKCSNLSVTRSQPPLKYPYQLKGHTLEVQDTTKYLGVDLQSMLSWKNHIDRITKKSNSMLGFLRRNLKSTCVETKTNAYMLSQHGQAQSGILCIRVEPQPERANTKDRDDPMQGCKICFQPLQKNQQRIIDARCSPMGITRIQEDKNPAYPTV